MRLSITLLSILLLNGCLATPQEARNEQPSFESTSSKTPQQLAECIYTNWTNTRVMLERDNTTHVVSFGELITIFTRYDSIFADVRPNESGSYVTMYKTFKLGYVVENNRKDIVKSCIE